MRVVERPDSTTYWDEFPFHLLKSKEEFINAVQNVPIEDITLWKRTVNNESFQPMVWFLIRVRDDPLTRFMGYVAPMMITVDVDKDDPRIAHLKNFND